MEERCAQEAVHASTRSKALVQLRLGFAMNNFSVSRCVLTMACFHATSPIKYTWHNTYNNLDLFHLLPLASGTASPIHGWNQSCSRERLACFHTSLLTPALPSKRKGKSCNAVNLRDL